MTRAIILLVVLVPAAALADEGSFTTQAGLGVTLESPPRDLDAHYGGHLHLKSTYGMSDHWRVAAPLLVERTEVRRDAVAGLGIEREFGDNPHLRVYLSAGLASRLSWDPASAWDGGGYLGAGLRWMFMWGTGLGVDAMGAAYQPLVGKSERSLVASSALSLYSEW